MDIVTNFFSNLSHNISQFFSTLNFLDLVLILIVLFYVREGYMLGFTLAFLDLISFIIAFIAALKFYSFLAGFFTLFFGMPIGLANALGFFLVAFISEVVMSLISRRGVQYLPGLPPGSRIGKLFSSVNHWLGILPGMVSAFIIIAFLLSVIVTFPSSPFIKQAVNNSVIGSNLVANTSQFESTLNKIFGGALNDTLDFLTVEPKSTETVELHFKVANGTVDTKAEQAMFAMVNAQRDAEGLDKLSFNTQLQDLAR